MRFRRKRSNSPARFSQVLISVYTRVNDVSEIEQFAYLWLKDALLTKAEQIESWVRVLLPWATNEEGSLSKKWIECTFY